MFINYYDKERQKQKSIQHKKAHLDTVVSVVEQLAPPQSIQNLIVLVFSHIVGTDWRQAVALKPCATG